MYLWRKLTDEQRKELLGLRRFNDLPWHSPLHCVSENGRYLITAACYEHKPIVGKNPQRLKEFSKDLLSTITPDCEQVFAWCVLPNHYHALVLTRRLRELLKNLGRLHGRTSFDWNGEDKQRGRKVWHNCAETGMKSDGHFWATLNYVHHNPVHHGYVDQWQDWPFGSGLTFVERVGREKAAEVWHAYPLHEYGKAWDPPNL